MFGIVNALTPGVVSVPAGASAAFVVASGNYLTAVGGGGKTSDPLHTDAKEVRQWEMFQLVGVGHDLGDALSYFIVPQHNATPLAAINGGGETKNAIFPLGVGPFPNQPLPRAVFRLERQPNNTYALRTSIRTLCKQTAHSPENGSSSSFFTAAKRTAPSSSRHMRAVVSGESICRLVVVGRPTLPPRQQNASHSS
jgi:hypothetical protein